MLDATNDRAITRLAVPDGPRIAVEHQYKEPAAATERVLSAYAYSPTGQVVDATWSVAGLHGRTEANPRMALEPALTEDEVSQARLPSDPGLHSRSWAVRVADRRNEASTGRELAQHRRATLRDGRGLATETYRDISVADALMMLV